MSDTLPALRGLRCDVFCRVIDNFGDAGVCWRLVRELRLRYGWRVRIIIDDLDTLARLAPQVRPGLAIQHAEGIDIARWSDPLPPDAPADVVIEAFACEIPPAYAEAMARRSPVPHWINLEYLSAESWVEECHGLLSPQPHSTLKKYFYFPGFTPQTGGLLREKGLFSERAAFDEQARAEFWDSLGIAAPTADELRISLFCYENNALPVMLNEWATGNKPIGVVATSGLAARQVESWFGEQLPERRVLRRGSLTVYGIPFLSQAGYDRLLWACDINFVRGEDSFVRAQWAQQPFIWQIYPQAEEAHFAKLGAFLNRFLGSYPDPRSIRECFLAWNGKGKMAESWRKFAENRQLLGQHGKVWARQLDQTGDLANNLVSFVRGN